MEFTPENRKKLTRWIIGVATACICIYLGVQNLDLLAGAVAAFAALFAPLILGGAIALIINVPMGYFEKKLWPRSGNPRLQKLRRPVAYLISLILICGVVVGIVALVIPELVAALTMIVKTVMDYLNRLNGMSASELEQLPFGKYLLQIDWNGLLASLQNWLKNQGGNILNTVIGSVSTLVGSVYDFILSFIFSIYLLFGKETLSAQLKRLARAWLPKPAAHWLIHGTCVLGENLGNFISAQTLEAVILGVLCMVGMWLLKIPYAPMVGALVGVTALIPVVGAFIGTIVGAFMILTVSPMKAVAFVVFLLVLQQLEGNLIYPKVMGSKVNLPAMWILAAVTVGGSLGGAVGMLLAVPIASSAYILLREATEYRESKLAASAPKKAGEESVPAEETSEEV